MCSTVAPLNLANLHCQGKLYSVAPLTVDCVKPNLHRQTMYPTQKCVGYLLVLEGAKAWMIDLAFPKFLSPLPLSVFLVYHTTCLMSVRRYFSALGERKHCVIWILEVQLCYPNSSINQLWLDSLQIAWHTASNMHLYETLFGPMWFLGPRTGS